MRLEEKEVLADAFPNFEEIRRSGKLCDVQLEVWEESGSNITRKVEKVAIYICSTSLVLLAKRQTEFRRGSRRERLPNLEHYCHLN